MVFVPHHLAYFCVLMWLEERELALWCLLKVFKKFDDKSAEPLLFEIIKFRLCK